MFYSFSPNLCFSLSFAFWSFFFVLPFPISMHFFVFFSSSPHTKNRGLAPRDKMFYPKLFRLPAKGLGNARKIEWRSGNLKMSTRSALRYIFYADLLHFITRSCFSFRKIHIDVKNEINVGTREKTLLFSIPKKKTLVI